MLGHTWPRQFIVGIQRWVISTAREGPAGHWQGLALKGRDKHWIGWGLISSVRVQPGSADGSTRQGKIQPQELGITWQSQYASKARLTQDEPAALWPTPLASSRPLPFPIGPLKLIWLLVPAPLGRTRGGASLPHFRQEQPYWVWRDRDGLGERFALWPPLLSSQCFSLVSGYQDPEERAVCQLVAGRSCEVQRFPSLPPVPRRPAGFSFQKEMSSQNLSKVLMPCG